MATSPVNEHLTYYYYLISHFIKSLKIQFFGYIFKIIFKNFNFSLNTENVIYL